MSRKLVTNILVNILGYALPLAVGLACTPYIIHQLGAEKFGFLSVAWVIIGYFSIFDLGLGRALTQGLATRLSDGRERQALCLSVKTIGALLMLGLIAASTLFVSRSALLDHVFAVSPGFRDQASLSILFLALGIPGVLIYNGLKGISDAFEIFTVSSVIRALLGIWNFASPVAVIYLGGGLPDIIICLVSARLFSVIVFLAVVYKQFLSKALLCWDDGASFVSIARSGGWMTVSNIISPLMTYMDRFFVSAISGLSAIQYYTTPYDVVSRLSFIPESIFNVLFPKMSKINSSAGDDTLYSRSMTGIFLVMYPLSLLISSVGPTLLGAWLGPEFQSRSTAILNILAVGLFINSMARVPYNHLQATGKPHVTATIHMTEFPFYVGALIGLLNYIGVTGAAVAWMLRMLLDFIAMHIAATGGRTGRSVFRDIQMPTIFAAAIFGNLFINNLFYNILYSGFVFTAFVYMVLYKSAWIVPSIKSLIRKKA